VTRPRRRVESTETVCPFGRPGWPLESCQDGSGAPTEHERIQIMRAFRSLVAGAVVCVSMTPTVKSDYLRRTGPPPLRLAADSPRSVSADLPPLSLFDPPSPPAEPPKQEEPAATLNSPAESIYDFWRAFWDSIASRSTMESGSGPAAPPDPQQVRQRLFELLISKAPGTNSLQGGIVVPVSFVEPPPVSPPLQSSATYSTP
jgi:hypothetical protein